MNFNTRYGENSYFGAWRENADFNKIEFQDETPRLCNRGVRISRVRTHRAGSVEGEPARSVFKMNKTSNFRGTGPHRRVILYAV